MKSTISNRLSSYPTISDLPTKMQGELDHVHDVEKEARAQDDLANTTVFSLAWDGLNLEIIQRKTSISILTDVSGVAMAGNKKCLILL